MMTDAIAYKSIEADGKVRVVMRSEVDRMMARLGTMNLKRKMNERLDRCCHGGIVAFRVPLWRRISSRL